MITYGRRILTALSRSASPDTEVVAAARAAGINVVEPASPTDRWVTANGVRLHLLDWGNGQLPPLLFLHGFAQQAHSWDFASLALRHQFHVLALDFRGHGDSEWSKDGAYALDQHVADVEEVVAALQVRQYVVCGLSMGGRVAYLHAASAGAGVRALIVAEAAPVATVSGRRAVTDFTSGFLEPVEFEEVVAKVLSYNPRRNADQVRGSLRNNLRQLADGRWTWKYDPAVREARNHARIEPEVHWEAMAGIKCPTLFVLGGESDMVQPQTVDRMLATVPGSRAEYVPKAGHLAAGDNPVGFDTAVRGFLEQLAARPTAAHPASKGN